MCYKWNQECRDCYSHIFDILQNADDLVADNPDCYNTGYQECKKFMPLSILRFSGNPPLLYQFPSMQLRLLHAALHISLSELRYLRPLPLLPLIFLGSGMAFGIAALVLVWIGSRVILSIRRQQKKFEIEDETYNKVKEAIK